jgi:hypothetical protein
VQFAVDSACCRHAAQRGVAAASKILDPFWTTAYITRNHGYLVYGTLFGVC